MATATGEEAISNFRMPGPSGPQRWTRAFRFATFRSRLRSDRGNHADWSPDKISDSDRPSHSSGTITVAHDAIIRLSLPQFDRQHASAAAFPPPKRKVPCHPTALRSIRDPRAARIERLRARRPMYCAETIDRLATSEQRIRLSCVLWWDFDLKRPSFLPAHAPWAPLA